MKENEPKIIMDFSDIPQFSLEDTHYIASRARIMVRLFARGEKRNATHAILSVHGEGKGRTYEISYRGEGPDSSGTARFNQTELDEKLAELEKRELGEYQAELGRTEEREAIYRSQGQRTE